jgi:hypothetical protein
MGANVTWKSNSTAPCSYKGFRDDSLKLSTSGDINTTSRLRRKGRFKAFSLRTNALTNWVMVQRVREIAPCACAPPLTATRSKPLPAAFQLAIDCPHLSAYSKFFLEIGGFRRAIGTRFFTQWRDLAQQQTSSLSSTYVQKSPRFATNTPSPLKMRKMILHAFKARSRA